MGKEKLVTNYIYTYIDIDTGEIIPKPFHYRYKRIKTITNKTYSYAYDKYRKRYTIRTIESIYQCRHTLQQRLFD